MSKQKTASQRMVQDGFQTNNKPPSSSSVNDFAKKMLHYPDPKEAAKLVADQAALLFDQERGDEIEKLQIESNELEALFKVSTKQEKSLADKERGTRKYRKTGIDLDKNLSSGIGFLQWSGDDQIMMVFVTFIWFCMMVLGLSNVYSNLMASGEPLFLEEPWLAWSLSMIVPAASFAIKFVSNFFEYDTTRKHYAKFIYFLMFAGIIYWSALFSQNYQGLTSSGIDWNNLLEGGGGDPIFVWIQLITEILIASALFLVIEDIYKKYYPTYFTPNPEYVEAERALASHRKTHVVLRDKYGDVKGRRARRIAEREALINEHVADFMSLRSRFNSIQNFTD